MDGYISKPIRARELFDTIAMLIATEVPTQASKMVPTEEEQAKVELATSADELIDWSAALKTAQGSQNFLKELVQLLLEESAKTFVEIHRAIDQQDAKATRSTAKSAGQDVTQARIDLLQGPHEILQALHPFEIGDDDPAGIAQDVRENEDVALVQNLVRLERRGTVGAFRQDLAIEPPGVSRSDLILQRARGKDVAGKLQHLRTCLRFFRSRRLWRDA